VPANFVETASFFSGYSKGGRNSISVPHAVSNPQTVTLCQQLNLRDPIDEVEDLNRSSNSSGYFSSPVGFSTPKRHYSNNSTYTSFNSPYTPHSSDRSSISSNSASAQSHISNLKKAKLSLPPAQRSSADLTDSDSSLLSSLEFTIDRNGTYSFVFHNFVFSE